MKNIIITLCSLLFFFSKNYGQEISSGVITEKLLTTFKMPYDSYHKLTLLAQLKKLSENDKSENISLLIASTETQLVTDIAYLDFIIKNNQGENEYASYVMNKIIYGIREGYIKGGDEILSENLIVAPDEDVVVNMKSISGNIKIPESQKLEFDRWYKKFFMLDRANPQK